MIVGSDAVPSIIQNPDTKEVICEYRPATRTAFRRLMIPETSSAILSAYEISQLNQKPTSVEMWGPPGGSKTTSVKLVSEVLNSKLDILTINCNRLSVMGSSDIVEILNQISRNFITPSKNLMISFDEVDMICVNRPDDAERDHISHNDFKPGSWLQNQLELEKNLFTVFITNKPKNIEKAVDSRIPYYLYQPVNNPAALTNMLTEKKIPEAMKVVEIIYGICFPDVPSVRSIHNGLETVANLFKRDSKKFEGQTAESTANLILEHSGKPIERAEIERYEADHRQLKMTSERNLRGLLGFHKKEVNICTFCCRLVESDSLRNCVMCQYPYHVECYNHIRQCTKCNHKRIL